MSHGDSINSFIKYQWDNNGFNHYLKGPIDVIKNRLIGSTSKTFHKYIKMMENIRQMRILIKNCGIKAFSAITSKINETNIFPFVLEANNYERINNSLYKKGKEELINIKLEKEKWKYKNLKSPYDTGTAINFIANRLYSEKVKPTGVPKDFFRAAAIAKGYYEQYIKSIKKQVKLIESKSLPKLQKQKRA